ncbi:MAG: hypothetical protein ACRYFX_24390 [Janthinobacterium lividum]
MLRHSLTTELRLPAVLKIKLAVQGAEYSPGHDPRTDPLRSVMEFLLV